MSEVARQFNIMSETLRSGMQGISNAKLGAKQAELETMKLEHGIEKENAAIALEAERYKERQPLLQQQLNQAADAKEARDEQIAFGEELAGLEVTGIRPDTPQYDWMVSGDGANQLELMFGVKAEKNPATGKLGFSKLDPETGKKYWMKNKFMMGKGVGLSMRLAYDPLKDARGQVNRIDDELKAMQSGLTPENEVAAQVLETGIKNKEKEFLEASNRLADVRANPSKYEYAKTMEAARLYTQMRPEWQKRFKGLIDLQLLKLKTLADLDIARGKTSGANLDKIDMYDNEGNKHVFYNPKTIEGTPNPWIKGNAQYDLAKKLGYTSQEPKEHTQFKEIMRLNDKFDRIQSGKTKEFFTPSEVETWNKHYEAFSQKDLAEIQMKSEGFRMRNLGSDQAAKRVATLSQGDSNLTTKNWKGIEDMNEYGRSIVNGRSYSELSEGEREKLRELKRQADARNEQEPGRWILKK